MATADAGDPSTEVFWLTRAPPYIQSIPEVSSGSKLIAELKPNKSIKDMYVYTIDFMVYI